MLALRTSRIAATASVLVTFAMHPARAGDASSDSIFPIADLAVRIDVRAIAADGERTWLKDGFGKTRFGNGDGLEGRLALANAALVWQPHFAWDLSAHLHAQANPGQYNGVDLVEAFLKWKPIPSSNTRFSARVGTFFPPISMEHDGVAWTPTRTLTPSAINSWVGEEVLVLGLEGTVDTKLDEHEFKLTGALFENNDTSGTLLTYRGWAMHDVLATVFGDFAIPDRGPAWNAFYDHQAPSTEPTREVDGRFGSYVRFDWSPPAPVSVNVMYYDNHGDPEVEEEGQYGWRTRFVNVGVAVDLDENTELLAQYMNGETVMGHPTPDGWMADMGFTSAYLLVSRKLDFGQLAGRVDWFETSDRTFEVIDNNNEDGWAGTLAYRAPACDWATVVSEALYIDSDHPARIDQGLDPRQQQFLFQLALQVDLK
jgi:hypothetical protein